MLQHKSQRLAAPLQSPYQKLFIEFIIISTILEHEGRDNMTTVREAHFRQLTSQFFKHA